MLWKGYESFGGRRFLYQMTDMLILARIELIFFTVPSEGAMFWMFGGNSVGNTGMFLLLLSRAYTD